MLSSLRQKYRALVQDAQYKGFWKFLVSKYYEHSYRLKFRRLGITYPDGTFNLDTTNSRSLNKDAVPNQASSFYHLKKVFDTIGLPPDQITLIDIGCGDGRMLNFGMMKRLKEVYGIELDEMAADKARKNCGIMQQHGFTTLWHVETADACTCSIPGSVNLIYLYNPFGEKTMSEVVDNIMKFMDGKKEPVYIAYCIPSFPELFLQHAICKKIYQSFNKQKDHSDLVIFKLENAD